MTKQELIAQMAEHADISKKDADEALNAFVKVVKGSLAKGESVTVVGFGTFGVSKRDARKGRNPQTGAVIDIPARTVPTFKAGKGLKEAV